MEQVGFSPKELYFGQDGRRRLISGIEKLAGAVKSTLGPGGNTVLIESPKHTHGMTSTKDGVTVAKDIDLLDPVENLAVRVTRQASDETGLSAGDGTTTAIVLAEALVRFGDEELKDSVNRIGVLRELTSLGADVRVRLRRCGRRLNRKIMRDVASISANNDRRIGKLVADVYAEVGKNGIVTVERSQTMDTTSEVTHGFKVARGYASSLFVNDHKRDECVFEDVLVLVCDAEIHNILQIENILKPVIAQGSKLLIIAPCSVNVVNTLAANVVRNSLKVCVIEPPSFGYKKHELMQDIALAVGAKYYSEKTGDDLSLISYGDLGHALKVVVGKSDTVIVNSALRTDVDAVEARVSQLWDAHKLAVKKHDKSFIMSRIAALTGGVGVIYSGGATETERKELFDRIDDSVCAVRSALEEGVLPGGGVALHDISDEIVEFDHDSSDLRIAKRVMRNALRVPLSQIWENSGVLEDTWGALDPGYPKGHGLDVKELRTGNMIEMGVVDPVKVTCAALENAVSVAVTILSTNAIITMARTYEAK